VWRWPVFGPIYSHGAHCSVENSLISIHLLHYFWYILLKVDGDAATDIKDLEKVYNRLQAAEILGDGCLDPDPTARPVGMAVGSR